MLQEIGLDLPFSMKINQLLGFDLSLYYLRRVGRKAMKIKFNDVTYTYQQGTPYEYKALDHINLTIEQGKYYAIVGQTGSGKSTLIQHFNGLLKPTNGNIEHDELTIHSKTKDKFIRPIRQKLD